MFHAIKTVRTYQPTPFPRSVSPNLGRQTSAVRFREINKVSSSQPDSAHNMEKAQKNPSDKSGDVMSHSFGEGYATRSDEEGFGGIYGGNQSRPFLRLRQKFIHENHPAYDKTQGSELKDKEKARHQTNASAYIITYHRTWFMYFNHWYPMTFIASFFKSMGYHL